MEWGARRRFCRAYTCRPAVERSPYALGSSFFSKVKFDEPYMMYRDWREVTKMLLNKKAPKTLPRGKMKRPETKLYSSGWFRKSSAFPRHSHIQQE